MKLVTKLILAFLLLAVLPLSWISVYSYQSSINAFRNAVEAESETLAESMGSRMDTVRRDLAYRVERLGNFPFQQLLTLKGDKVDPNSNPLMADLMSRLGDMAPMVDSLEFSPDTAAEGIPPSSGAAMAGMAAPMRPPPPSGKPGRGGGSAPDAPRPRGPRQLVIHLSPEAQGQKPAVGPAPDSVTPDEVVMHFRPNLPKQPGPGGQPVITEADRQKRQERLKQILEFQVYLEKLSSRPSPNRPAGEPRPAAGASRTSGEPGARIQPGNPLANNFGSVVRSDGQAIGTLRARVSSPQIYRNVLARGRRRGMEIPFILDAKRELHTSSQTDQAKLEALNLAAVLKSPEKMAESADLRDWVVVTRKDQESDLTFGIARPISEPLRQIRSTAARNLAYGLGLVGLALVGIIPFSAHIKRNLGELTRGAEQLARGDLSARVPVHTRDEIGLLAESFIRMARDLSENQKNLVAQERMRKELEMSRRIQEELLPKRPLIAGSVEVKGISIPAREVGGDFFNYFPLSNGEVAILVGDVSGKGVAAAILMANLQATLQARLPLIPDLVQLARQMDQEISASTPQEVYLTLFMGILNPGQERLRYVNAGHNPQFALHARGELERLESTGRPLGLLPGGEYAERQIGLEGGDALFLYTDGLVEAENGAGSEFGQQRLEALLSQAHIGSINEILTRVETAVRSHRGGVEAADDATMVALTVGF